ncbi:MAG: dTDP-4-dehydrorhamnose 3,5-epimerase [Saprospiraceae bacterium]|nr:dTDP-4-dehydrorhamnose 3,5-epimerase [Saprospiraceae bacterium]MBP7699089.1 dTDP-4-dehydrorhamnose 3,5-epimerase [Saprospiraceae bacterium]
MPIIDTHIEGLKIFEPQVWEDERGYFYESYNFNTFAAGGIDANFVQDNQAFSTYGVLRGLHYQVGEMAQAKLVRVIQGEVLDVVVDIRPDSATYGEWYSILLNETNKRQFFVPRGFAHGYVVLSPTALFFYKCDNFYSKQHEGGILFNDSTLNINWHIPLADATLSEKDLAQPIFGEHRKFY